MKDNTLALAHENIGSLVLKFSLPSIVGMLANGLSIVADRIFVGRGVGPSALAGVAIVFPLVLFTQAFSMLIGHGAATIVSLRLGQGRRAESETLLGTATTLAAIVGMVLVVIVGLFVRPLLTAFGGSGPVLQYAMRFTIVLLPGLFLQVLGFVLNNMIRSQGNPVIALVTMLVSVCINCALNPVFIFGLKLGIAGSALATDVANALVVVWLLALYRRPGQGLRLRFANLGIDRKATLDLVGAGLAPCSMQLANGATLILANHLVCIYGGADGIAVLGIATGLFTLMLMPLIGIRQGIQPIIGYNYGASAFGRVRAAVVISLTATGVLCGAVYLVFFVFSRAILELFVKDAPSIVALGVPSLRIFLASVPVVGIAVVGSVYFQSVKKSGTALLVTLVRQVIVLVPLYVVLPYWFGLTGVWLAGPLSDLAAALLTAALLVPEMQTLARMTLKSPEMNVHTPSLTSTSTA